jgi:hypothetical protein
MLARQSAALCEELAKLDRALGQKPQADLEAVGRRIGRWLGRYPAAAKVLDIVVRHDADGRACGLTLSCPLAPGQWAAHTQGAYLLRTNCWAPPRPPLRFAAGLPSAGYLAPLGCPERDPAQLWRWYIQLTQAEAAFRTAKSDLGLRPICHQSTARVEAHILVCFLALALWRTLEMWMRGKGLGTCARRLVEEVATLKSMDVLLPVRRGEELARLRLRCVARPERRVAELLVRLGLDLPTRSRIIEELPAAAENVVQKTEA